MGEAKRRAAEVAVKAVTDAATDEGKIIELGWLALRAQAIPADAPQAQLDGMREAFFAGAQHLLASIMTVLDPGIEPTERDGQRMHSIDRELRAFIDDYVLRHLPTEGRA